MLKLSVRREVLKAAHLVGKEKMQLFLEVLYELTIIKLSGEGL